MLPSHFIKHMYFLMVSFTTDAASAAALYSFSLPCSLSVSLPSCPLFCLDIKLIESFAKIINWINAFRQCTVLISKCNINTKHFVVPLKSDLNIQQTHLCGTCKHFHFLFSYLAHLYTGNSYWRGRLSAVDILIKIAYFVKQNFFFKTKKQLT